MGRRGDDAPAAPDGENDAGGMSRVSCGLWPLATLARLCCGTGFGTPEGSASPVGCCAQRKATRRWTERKRVPGGHLPPKVAKRPEGVSKYKGCARPARRTPIFARAAKRVVGADGGKRCGWNEPRFLRPLAARNACEVVLRHRFWDAAPNPGRGLRPLHPALDPPAPPSPQFFNAYILKVIRHDLLRRAARLRHAIGAPLAHAHAMAIARAGHHELALLRAQAGDEG